MIADKLDALRTSGTSEEHRDFLEDSGWLEDVDPEQLAALYEEWRTRWVAALREGAARLGEPNFDSRRDRGWLDGWYPEALEAAGWKTDDGLVYLAVEHQSPEVPIGLTVGKHLAE